MDAEPVSRPLASRYWVWVVPPAFGLVVEVPMIRPEASREMDCTLPPRSSGGRWSGRFGLMHCGPIRGKYGPGKPWRGIAKSAQSQASNLRQVAGQSTSVVLGN